MSKKIVLATICFCIFNVQANADTPTVSFDHTAGDQITTVKAEPGDAITVTIHNTCPALFSYSKVQQKEAPRPSDSRTGLQSLQECINKDNIESQFEAAIQKANMCVAQDHTLFFTHDKNYGGYVIDIQSKEPVKIVRRDNINDQHIAFLNSFNDAYNENSERSCDEITTDAAKRYAGTVSQKLSNIKNTIVVAENESSIEFSGGLTISKLRNPKFSLVPNPDANAGADASRVIALDGDAMDIATLGIAAFVHYHPTACKGRIIQLWCTHIAYTLGLGVSTGNTALNAFVGPSFRTHDGSWFVTFGYNVGPRDRLPSGDRIGEPPASPNSLNNLASHTGGGVFIALSYAFAKPQTSYFTNAFSTNPPTATKPSNNDTPSGSQ